LIGRHWLTHRVYRAHDRQLERKVGLKIYGRDGEYVDLFRREARAVAQLAHPPPYAPSRRVDE
jgi:serine/threonine protein kinase